MTIRESRALAAVQRLGAPTTLEVAEACQCSTAAARDLLKGLEGRGSVRAIGRRWTVPSAALAEYPQPAFPVAPGAALLGTVCGYVAALVLTLILIGVVSYNAKL